MQSSRRSNVTRVHGDAASVCLKTRFLANKINHEYVTSALTGQKMSGFFSLSAYRLPIFCWFFACIFLFLSAGRNVSVSGDWFSAKSLDFWSKKDVFFSELVRQLSLLFCFRNRHHFYCGVVFVVFIFAPTESENTSILRQKARNLFACQNAC